MEPGLPFHLGCPAWSVPAWKGNFLPKTAAASDFLFHYSKVFNSVEGNSTFYALPKTETAERWASSVPDEFRFCFKVPRDISHGGGLTGNLPLLAEFFSFQEIFFQSGNLGPAFLQLHSSFGLSRFDELKRFCDQWPDDYPLAIEVRHREFFANGKGHQPLNDFLNERGYDRVIFDSGALYQSGPDDSIEAVSQTRKPNLPVHWEATSDQPFLRLVGRNQFTKADPWLAEAAKQAAKWISDGLHPFLFMHAPDDTFAPQLCERFYLALKRQLPELPDLDLSLASGDQMELF